MNIARQCIFALSLIFTTAAFSQTAGKDLNSPGSIISSEAMHVHFDKDIYLPGETIWFKAYLYNVNEISYTSTNFYVAIYDEKGKLLQQKQYPIFEGSSNGDFEIPDTIQSTRIQFRAFTRAMTINDSNNVYQKVLTVYSKQNNTDNSAVTRTKNLSFSPEGGQMVAELQNYVAFKAVYADGSPAMINGQIIEVERNKAVDSFFTNNMGLGTVILIPSPHKTYMAVWKDENGITKQTPLPTINRYGVSFHTEVINKELQYTIAKNRSSDSLSLLHLLVQMGNYKLYKADLVIANEMELSTAKFPIDSIPAGLMQLTLFDKGWNPLQERLVFIPGSGITQQPGIDRTEINAGAKAKNTIEIALPDTLFTNLSASIADINFYEQPGTHSIKQDLWFNTQLKEARQNTDQLLSSGNSNAIDLVTLANGWKKYNWQKATDKNSVKPEILDNYISLSVNYKEKNFAMPKDEALNLVIKNKTRGSQFYNLLAINQTGFKKDGLVFFDSVKISCQLNKTKDLANFFSISRDETWQAPMTINALPKKISFIAAKPTEQNYSVETFANWRPSKLGDTQTIKGVVVKSKYKGNPQLARIDELDKFYTTGMFSGTVRGVQFNVLDDPMAGANSDFASYFVYRIPGIKIMEDEFSHEKHLAVEESVSPLKKVLTPIPVFLDEIKIESVGYYDLSQIAYIKYIPGIVIGGTFRSNVGAIYAYTKKGNEADPFANNMHSVYIKGYNAQKEFASPDYSDKTLLKEPDLRTTIYWNPNIIMDKTNNKVKIEYYNNDVSKKLLLTIEGVNAEGKLIHIEKLIE